MGHYSKQYEEWYEERALARANREQEITDRLVKQGLSERQIQDFIRMAKAFNLFKY